MIILLTKDLFFVPVVRSAATGHGVDVLVVASLADERLSDVDASTVIACIVDLGTVSIKALDDMASSIRESFPQAKLVAFGPHVQLPRLDAARSANFDIVLSRGQFDRRIAELVADWL